MLRRAAVLSLVAFCASAAPEPVPVSRIVSAVRAAIASHEADGPLAKTLHKWKPSERLDIQVIEELESEGAGPKAVAELERLRDLSATLEPPAVAPDFHHEDTPSIAEQRKVVGAAQHIALNYAKGLPDFLCTEVIRREDDLRGVLTLKDTLVVRLSYFDQHENYRLVSVNGKMANRGLEEVGGAVSEGEFGSLLATIFLGESKTVMRWDHWTTIRKRLAHVYTFRILAEHSTYRLQFRAERGQMRSTVAGQHGFIYIDRETNEVLRIITEADVPETFPVRASSTMLDYDFGKVGTKKFLLPLRAEVRMATEHLHTRNVVEFEDYRKFTGESTITFQ